MTEPSKTKPTRAETHPVMLDTNVMLYFLLDKSTKSQESHRLIRLCRDMGIPLVYAPSSLKDLFYTVPRILRRREQETAGRISSEGISFAPAAWACVNHITEIAAASPLGEAESQLARMLRDSHDDYEDNLLVASAESCRARYIATYDKGLQADYPLLCAPPATIERALGALRPLT